MIRFWLRISVTVLASLLVVGTTALAQDATCPEIVQAALDATDEQCSATGRNEACYGNVNLEATPQPGIDDFTFRTPGDLVAVSAVESLTLSSRVDDTGEWGVALMQLQANLPESLPGQNVTFLLFGDVQITNGVETNVDPITFDVAAQGNINVRGGPSTDDAPIASLSGGETVMANGRNADGSWLQVALADGSTGWVSADVVALDGDSSLLNVIDPLALPLNPMQAFYFQSGIGDAPCAEAPDSGILVQTPEGVGEIQFTVNDVNVVLGSTAYLQAQPGGDMTTSMVEGEATVTAGGASVAVPAGSFVTVPLDAQGRAAGTPSQPQPYDPTRMAVLPIRILPRAITIADPLSAVGILPAAGEWVWTMGTPLGEGCREDVVDFFFEVTLPELTPDGPFQLPGDKFGVDILLEAALEHLPVPPGAVYSNPDPNTYVVDFTMEGGSGHHEVRIIDSDHIEGVLTYTPGDGCLSAIEFPFEVVRAGASAAGLLPANGITPAAGEWQVVWEPPSLTCDSGGVSTTINIAEYESFQLSGDPFSAAMLYTSMSGYDVLSLADSSRPEPNTYMFDYSNDDSGSSLHFDVRVIDSDHMEGHYEETLYDCAFPFSFVATRVGD